MSVDDSNAAAQRWLEELATRLPRHAAVLRCLVAGVRADPRVVQLSVSCSVARGAGDELSDLDCELSLEAEAWPDGLALVEPLIHSAGSVVDVLHHRWPAASATPNRRSAVQYADGVQLDLMVWPVTSWSGMRPPDTVILHARREVYNRPWDPGRATPSLERLHEWCFLGWWMLLDADKYLRRNSPWEARQRLEEARDVAWRLAAAAQGLGFPEYGITALLDAPSPRLPAGVEATLAGLDVTALRAAVLECAGLMQTAWAEVREARVEGAGALPEPPLAAWARSRLRR